MISSAVTDETGQLVTLLRHQDGGYALALGYTRDQQWDFHVVGHYESRQDAEAGIKADKATQAEIAAEAAAQENRRLATIAANCKFALDCGLLHGTGRCDDCAGETDEPIEGSNNESPS